MSKPNHPVEKLVENLLFKGVEFEVVERPDVLWVGCVDYATNNTDESDIGATLKRFQTLVKVTEINDKINPDWGASLSINYNTEKPCGIMFANESYTDKQDERFDMITQPSGLWLRVSDSKATAEALLGRESHGTWEYFGALKLVAKQNGYLQNPDVSIEIEYHCHAGRDTPPHTNYAYIPIIRT